LLLNIGWRSGVERFEDALAEIVTGGQYDGPHNTVSPPTATMASDEST
jgi:hypothetical protein